MSRRSASLVTPTLNLRPSTRTEIGECHQGDTSHRRTDSVHGGALGLKLSVGFGIEDTESLEAKIRPTKYPADRPGRDP